MSDTLRCRGCGREFAVTRTLTPEEQEHPLCPRCESVLGHDASAPPAPTADPPPLPPSPRPSAETRTAAEVPGRPLPSPSDPTLSGLVQLPTLPGYRVLGVLGKGGMGVVFKAEQERANRRLVAVKMILARRGFDAEQDKRFEVEVNAVSAFEHPNIVRVYEVGEANGQRFFSMEYCPGGTLYDRLKQGLMPPREAAGLLAVVARAMAAVHARNIVHRDLKPLNILYDAGGRPKVTDFGLAKDIAADAGGTATGSVMGTLGYMSPEQASGQGNKATPETDVYALGAILYSCLTGRVPFAGSTVPDTLQQIQRDDPVPVRRLVPNAPRDLETICEKCLQKDPKRRYPTAAALADDLDRYLAGRPILARPVSRAEKVWKAARRRPAAAALIVTVALAGVGAAVAAALLFLANERERELRARADRAARQAHSFSAFMLAGLGEADFWTRYFPLHVGAEGKTAGSIRATPQYLRALAAHADAELADQPHELAKVRLLLANAMRSQAEFAACDGLLAAARAAFDAAPETTAEDRDRWAFSHACYLDEVGELTAAYAAFVGLLDRPQPALAPAELADTKVRLAWLALNRILLRGGVTTDPVGAELSRRAVRSLEEAAAAYDGLATPLARTKAAIARLMLAGARGGVKGADVPALAVKIAALPHGDLLLAGVTAAYFGESHRREGRFADAVAGFADLERKARDKFGPRAYLRLLALGALAGAEKTAAERSPVEADRPPARAAAIRHLTEGLATGRELAPRHPALALGYADLAAVLAADGQPAAAVAALKEAQALARFHPDDLAQLARKVEQELARLAPQ